MPAISLSGQSRQRQIVILGVGGLLLAGLLLFQVPRTLKMLNPDSASQPTPPAEQTAVNPAPVTPVAPPVPVTGTGSPVRAALLTRFRSKDPFVQQINPNATASGTDTESDAAAPASSEAATEPGAFRAVESSSGTAAAARTATIAVNGAEETVAVSNTFPNGNPVFKLVSVGKDSAKVGVASGKLGGGAQTVTLAKGEPLTLLNTVDGKRYKLELILVSS
jgi:hypothetical protein